jgi:hypothetical protein
MTEELRPFARHHLRLGKGEALNRVTFDGLKLMRAFLEMSPSQRQQLLRPDCSWEAGRRQIVWDQ